MPWYHRNATGAGSLATTDGTAKNIPAAGVFGAGITGGYAKVYTVTSGGVATLRATSTTNAPAPSLYVGQEGNAPVTITIPSDVAVPDGGSVRSELYGVNASPPQATRSTSALTGYTLKAGTHSANLRFYLYDVYVEEDYYLVHVTGAQLSYLPDALIEAGAVIATKPFFFRTFVLGRP